MQHTAPRPDKPPSGSPAARAQSSPPYQSPFDDRSSATRIDTLPAVQLASPSSRFNRFCADCQYGTTRLYSFKPAAVSESRSARRSSPGSAHGQPFPRRNASVCVSVVLSNSSTSANCFCDIPGAMFRVCKSVNCEARKPVGRNPSSYTCVTTRAARRRLAPCKAAKPPAFSHSSKSHRAVVSYKCIYIYIKLFPCVQQY